MSAQPEWPDLSRSDWAEEDLMHMPDDGNRYEILHGRLIVTPPAYSGHQRAEFRIARLLEDAAPADWEILPEPGVRLVNGNVEPDVVALRPGAPSDVLNYHYKHIALVVEVGSKSTSDYDADGKLKAYAESGISVYLRVMRNEWPAVYIHTVPTGAQSKAPKYDRTVIVPVGQTYAMTEPFPFTVDPARWLA